QLHVDVRPGGGDLVAQAHKAVVGEHGPGRDRGRQHGCDHQHGHGTAAPCTWISTSASATTWPARIFAVLRDSTAPSTRTAPEATRALPAPPLSQRPES